ncbi:ATP-binding protein [Hahella sp. HN01]|uniref:ATP-binding protein n=1 Tax=Hahella sp. HN01 TaxID=2847262 RepID=UPI001C1E93B0|nr:ATP-binding protein [Hahella sp. HN01]MBU6951134.1 sensor histidine kinase N-terminal domain-containing protein [Hahella sp. HN01]
MRSIKRFLLISLIAIICLGGLFTALANYHDSQEQVEELFDAELAQMARMLQSLLASQMKRTNLDHLQDALVYEDYAIDEREEAGLSDGEEYTPLGHKYEKKLAFQVWSESGKLLIQTKSASQGFTRHQAGFNSDKVDGEPWRTFTLFDENLRIWIQVAQQEDVRSELTEEIAEHVIWPSLLLIPIILLGVSWAVTRALKPLSTISKELKQRDYANLQVLDDANYPTELAILVDAINDLFQRLQATSDRERQFTADAAHELRTPLAGVKVHLQNAQEMAQSEPVSDCLRKALRGLDRLIHMVEQLLQLSRLDHERALSDAQPVQIDMLCQDILRESQPLIEEKNIRAEFNADACAPIQGNPAALSILLRNLVDNALRYSPKDSQITLQVKDKTLVIEDQGPGIPPEQRQQAMERFHRGKQQNEIGSGLGLSICQRIADLHRARISLDDRQDQQPGLRVQVSFP